jgi:hypothetical protein
VLSSLLLGKEKLSEALLVVAQHLGEGVVVEEWVITQAGRREPTA